MVSIDFVGSKKFPMSSNGGGSESKALDCWLIIGVAGMTTYFFALLVYYLSEVFKPC